jgi:hypothetical protein
MAWRGRWNRRRCRPDTREGEVQSCGRAVRVGAPKRDAERKRVAARRRFVTAGRLIVAYGRPRNFVPKLSPTPRTEPDPARSNWTYFTQIAATGRFRAHSQSGNPGSNPGSGASGSPLRWRSMQRVTGIPRPGASRADAPEPHPAGQKSLGLERRNRSRGGQPFGREVHSGASPAVAV